MNSLMTSKHSSFVRRGFVLFTAVVYFFGTLSTTGVLAMLLLLKAQ